MKCYKDHFGMIVNIVLAWIMTVIMTLASFVLMKTPINWVTLLNTGGPVFLIINFIITLIPINQLGNASAKKIGLKPGTLVFTLVAGIVPTLFFNTAMSGFMPALGIFYNEAIPKAARMGAWIDAFLKNWPIMFVVSYIASLIAGKLGEVVAIKTLGEPPIDH